MIDTPRTVGRPRKRGEIKKPCNLAIWPSRRHALDWLVSELNFDSRGDLVSLWIEQEMRRRKGDGWIDEFAVEAAA